MAQPPPCSGTDASLSLGWGLRRKCGTRLWAYRERRLLLAERGGKGTVPMSVMVEASVSFFPEDWKGEQCLLVREKRGLWE